MGHYSLHETIRAATECPNCGDWSSHRRSAGFALVERGLGGGFDFRAFEFRAWGFWRAEIESQQKACGTASANNGLTQNLAAVHGVRGDQDFVFASERLHGKGPRVPNMLVKDHLRPAAEQVIEIPPGHRFGFHNLRHALSSFLVETGTDPKTIQDMLRWADAGMLMRTYAHSRMDKRREAQGKMVAAMGLTEATLHLIQ